MTGEASQMHCQPRTIDPRPCAGCGKSFVPERSWQRFHSDQCRNKWHQDPKCPTCGRAEPRSTEANKRLWALYHLISEKVVTGGRTYSPEVWHYFFKGAFLGCVDIEMPNGKTRSEPNSTAKLDKLQFGDFMAEVEVWAAERGVYLPE